MVDLLLWTGRMQTFVAEYILFMMVYPPQHQNSSGRVLTTSGEYYPEVFNMKWVQVDTKVEICVYPYVMENGERKVAHYVDPPREPEGWCVVIQKVIQGQVDKDLLNEAFETEKAAMKTASYFSDEFSVPIYQM
jgi:hypothetical protein